MRPSNPDRCTPRRAFPRLVAAALSLALAGCVSKTLDDQSRFGLDGLPDRLPSQVAPEILAERGARIDRAIALESRGFIEADAATAPLVAPAGDAIAVQLRPTPTWRDLLGWSVEMPSPPPAVAIVRFDGETGAAKELALREPLHLGHTCDEESFLVESPRSGGERWIGAARWSDGEIEWLVADEAVNAMAARAKDGALAWCRSDLPGESASLRLRERDGSMWEWSARTGTTWLAPQFSGDGRYLFAIRQGDGRAALFAFDRADPDASVATVELSDRTTAATSLASTAALGEGSTLAGEPSWLVVHPEDRTLRRWRPDLGTTDRFPDGSFAFTAPIAGGRLLADRSALWFVEPAADGSSSASVMLDGRWIPRVLATGEGQAAAVGRALLFSITEEGFEVCELSIDPSPPVELSGELVAP